MTSINANKQRISLRVSSLTATTIARILGIPRTPPGSTKPGFKVYLPVRFHCPNDHTIACRSRKFYNLGNTTAKEYAGTIQSIFSPHREIGARTGIQTYIGVSLKKSGCEVCTYFNPEVYAPERLLQV